MKVGFLGCGKIGGAMLSALLEDGKNEVTFIQDPFVGQEGKPCPVTEKADETLLEKTDLVIESATADVLKENVESILKHCNLMVFSVTAFSDEAFYAQAKELTEKYGRTIYLPHGAILGLDGIADGRKVIKSVRIETTKNPKSLGRTDTERTVVYEGSTRQACREYPRNVNVHAAVALAGLGFDKTQSRIISDPAVSTNAHTITVDGDGIHFEIVVSSQAGGGVTGKYTPYSAVSSMFKVLGGSGEFRFV